MADNVFGVADDQYLTDAERALAADISRAFDTSRGVRDRAMRYYNLPAAANSENEMAIARATATADGINRLRIARMRMAQANPTPDRDRAQGIAQLATLLLGRDAFNTLMRDGFIKYTRDALGRTTAVPDYERWASQNVTRTGDGNLAVRGEDGQVRIVDPNSGQLVDTSWTRNDNTADPSGQTGDVFGSTYTPPQTTPSDWFPEEAGDYTYEAPPATDVGSSDGWFDWSQ